MTLLLAVALLADVVTSDELNYSVETKPGWEVVAKNKTKLHLRKDETDVQVLVVAGGPKSLPALAKWWRPSLDGYLVQPTGRVESKGKLGGEPCITVRVSGKDAHVVWSVARRGAFAYCFHVQGTGDEVASAEVEAIRASFKFLREAKPEAKTKNPAVKIVPRKKLEFVFWRFDCVKPAGLKQLDPEEFDHSERANFVVARFDAVAHQSRLMIRIYAQRKRIPVKLLAEQRLEEFGKRYKRHRPPVIDRKWKLPGARKSLRLELVGLGRVKVAEQWFFAESSNGCTYQIQIYASGAKNWDKPIKDFLANFKLRKRNGKSRIKH